ncbi:hypothetical protein QAD02_005648 [Eretmocerus hayati]|uniref:Uncharacterized protein n=1 Tax=Eretmocerus hayati TaxID=131215 RepID=A0ACC2NU63_9HYME|nr:hypothetical protein QAD02_005648 [Eretmocerus hayati]
MPDRTLQSKIPNGFIQHAISDFHVRSTNLCWDIRKFGCMSTSVNTLQFDKTVTLMKHSCKCDLHLSTDVEPHEKIPDHQKSLLKIKLYSYEGRGAMILVSVILRDSSQNAQITSEKKSWDLTSTNEVNLEFWLPPKKSRPAYRYSGFVFLSDFAYSGTLTIHILFEEYVEVNRSEKKSPISSSEIIPKSLGNFSEMYKQQSLVDVVFMFPGNKSLYAHSVILANACTYFNSMFTTSNMQERKTRKVNLTNDDDVTFDIFKAFLDYLYGVKELKEIDDMVKDLSILADKYDYPKLHGECENFLCDSVHKSNVASLLVFAHKYNYQSLRQTIFQFVKTHGMNAFKELDDFKEVCQNPKLLNELISSIQA